MWKNLKRLVCGRQEFIRIRVKERVAIGIKGVLVVIVLNYFFYRTIWVSFLLLPIGILFYVRKKNELLLQKKDELKQQFKELLLLACAGMKAGYAADNAFLNSQNELQTLYGEEAGINQLLCCLKSGLANNIHPAKLWKTIGKETQIVEIIEFAEIYEIAQISGGNMTSILERTAEIISEQLEMEREIQLLMSAKKLEQKIMNGMPFALMIYMEMTAKGYFYNLYHNVTGVTIMTVCLAIYLGAYALSLHIVDSKG